VQAATRTSDWPAWRLAVSLHGAGQALTLSSRWTDSFVEGSTGRPRECTAAEEVAVEVRHRLAGVTPVVEDESIARGIEPEQTGNLRRFEEEVTQHLAIFGAGFSDSGDWLAGYDEHMDRRLGVDIVESDDLIVLIHDASGDFAAGDFLEQGLAHVQREGSADDEKTVGGVGFMGKAGTEVRHNLVMHPLATGGPAPGPDESFDATTQTGESHRLGRVGELVAERGAQSGKEEKLGATGGSGGQTPQVGARPQDEVGVLRVFLDLQAEGAQHTGKCLRELADRDARFSEFDFEVMEHRGGRLAEHVGVEVGGGTADEFHDNGLGRAGDHLAAGGGEHEGIGVQLDHGCSSSLRTAWTKSVAS
jgi:hypothetical protein